MTLSEISIKRLICQRISYTKIKSAKEIVGWMGAMQAQDFSMAKWAIGIRMLNATNDKVEAALNNGEIIRTHVMRPTWHFVSADDIYWMLDLTASRIKGMLKGRNRNLELSPELISKTNDLLINFLTGKNITRDEITRKFKEVKIKTDENRLSHQLLHAELDQIICSGPIKANKQTYALLPERVPNKLKLSREEALGNLAKRYFTSHCPATVRDFAWWSGLSLTDARKALESVRSGFISEKTDTEEYWFTDNLSINHSRKSNVYLLPAYDEFMISYRDRSASISFDDHKRAISVNGIFYPVVVIDGRVSGLWRRTTHKNKIIIEIMDAQLYGNEKRDIIMNSAHTYAHFFDKEIEINFIDA